MAYVFQKVYVRQAANPDIAPVAVMTAPDFRPRAYRGQGKRRVPATEGPRTRDQGDGGGHDRGSMDAQGRRAAKGGEG